MQSGSYAPVSVSSRQDFPAQPGNPGRGKNEGAFGQYLKKADLASLAPLKSPPQRDIKQQARSNFYAADVKPPSGDRPAGKKEQAGKESLLRQAGKREKEPAEGAAQETGPFQPAAAARAKAANGPCIWEQGRAKNALEGPGNVANHIPGTGGGTISFLSPEAGENMRAQIVEGFGALDVTAVQVLPAGQAEALVQVLPADQAEALVQVLPADQAEALHRPFQEVNPGLEHLQIDVSLFANEGENALAQIGEGATAEVLTAEEAQAFQQLQHVQQELESPAWGLGEDGPPESTAAVSLPRPENPAGAEEPIFAGLGETGEIRGTGEKEAPEITMQSVQHENPLQGETPASRAGAEKVVNGRNQGTGETIEPAGSAGGQKMTGTPQAETLMPAETADQVLNSLQVPGGMAENLEMQGNLHPVSSTPLPKELLSKAIFQIVEHLEHRSSFNTQGVQELRLRLQPESLGEVLVRIRRQQGMLSAEIMTRHPAVQEMLESQLDTLRQRFQAANLPVEHLDVLLQDEGKSGFTFSGEGSGRDQPRAFAAKTGGETVVQESKILTPGRRGAGGKVDCLV